MKTNNKKGFTLAELLIVVAIIAVLTAIAVPLFVGALNSAEDNVKEANIRAVRVQAVSEILLKNADGKTTDETIFTGGKLVGPWKVTANVSKSGAVSNLTFALESGSGDKCEADPDASGDNDKKYTVTVYLTLSDLNA